MIQGGHHNAGLLRVIQEILLTLLPDFLAYQQGHSVPFHQFRKFTIEPFLRPIEIFFTFSHVMSRGWQNLNNESQFNNKERSLCALSSSPFVFIFTNYLKSAHEILEKPVQMLIFWYIFNFLSAEEKNICNTCYSTWAPPPLFLAVIKSDV